MSDPFAKPIHKAAKIRPDGAVSALCYLAPRAINLQRASWTLVDAQVTCRACRSVMELLAKGPMQ